MVFLAVVGAVVITAALIYITLAFLALFVYSDEPLWDAIKCNWGAVGIIVLGLVFFWYLWWAGIGSQITIGFG